MKKKWRQKITNFNLFVKARQKISFSDSFDSKCYLGLSNVRIGAAEQRRMIFTVKYVQTLNECNEQPQQRHNFVAIVCLVVFLFRSSSTSSS
jgi:hypothetical protein